MLIKNNLSQSDLRVSTVTLILSNLVPLAGVLFFKWDLRSILFLYWSESVIVGLYSILKIFLSTWFNKETKAKKYVVFFLIPFFICHYGFFMFIHLSFLVALLNTGTWNEGEMNLLNALYFWVNWSIIFSLFSLLFSHGVSFISSYLKKKNYLQKNAFVKAMFYPYGRIFIMQLVIILGGILVVVLGSKLFLLILLIILKIVVDLLSHLRSHGYFPGLKMTVID